MEQVYSTTNLTVPNNIYYTPIQLKLPIVFDETIKIDDPVYTFDKVMKGVNLKKYLVSRRKDPRGRSGYNPITMLKVVLFAFQLKGYASTREIEDMCFNDIRFRWLLQYEKNYPTHMTISNFMNNYLKGNIQEIFVEINNYIFEKANVDTNHLYIDGTKIEANANKYTWVWKNACITNRDKLFNKITVLIDDINKDLIMESVEYKILEKYEIDYLEYIFNDFTKRYNINTKKFVHGKGKRKDNLQRKYELFKEYISKLKEYATKIETCGEHRNSYSKTDKDATFMRMKKDYMGNDQLLPAYNVQLGICDEFISILDVNQYASDSDCFVPLLERFYQAYKKYPEYPITDAGYGTYNNYLYCETKGMKKYMKFPLYKKETKNSKYHNDPFRPTNFKTNEEGSLICPNNKKFNFLYNRPVKNNKYGRTEEIYECEDCSNCPLKSKCTKSAGNRRIQLNRELTSFHKEVIENLESIQGCLLRMNRSIQAEGAFGILKQDRFYRRIVRKGLTQVKLEITLIACAYNIYKFHNILKRKSF
jgi:transposase